MFQDWLWYRESIRQIHSCCTSCLQRWDDGPQFQFSILCLAKIWTLLEAKSEAVKGADKMVSPSSTACGSAMQPSFAGSQGHT